MNYISYLFFYSIFCPSVLMLSITLYGSKQSKYINPSSTSTTTSNTKQSTNSKYSSIVKTTTTSNNIPKVKSYKLNHLMMVAQHFDNIERNKLNELNKQNHFIESNKLRNNNIDIFQPVIVGKYSHYIYS